MPLNKELQRKRVVDLRKQAYKMNLSTLKKSEIKLANKRIVDPSNYGRNRKK